jgi:hypothetical protein
MTKETQSFSESAKIRLIQRGMTVTALAAKIKKSRTNVSLVIHGRRYQMPKVEAAVRKELGL